MRLKVVYDTNVLVSALWKPGSIPDVLVSLVLHDDLDLIALCYSSALLTEYQGVLSRPRFPFSSERVAKLLGRIKAVGRLVKPQARLSVITHEPDNRVLECAKAARAHYLVTGDKKHFSFARFEHTRIVTPEVFAHIVAEKLIARQEQDQAA